jgi:hypothetical protein
MQENIKQMVFDHVDRRLYFISADEPVDYTALFDKMLLESTTTLDHHYVFEHALALLIAFEDIDLRIVGVNEEGKTLYQRVV